MGFQIFSLNCWSLGRLIRSDKMEHSVYKTLRIAYCLVKYTMELLEGDKSKQEMNVTPWCNKNTYLHSLHTPRINFHEVIWHPLYVWNVIFCLPLIDPDLDNPSDGEVVSVFNTDVNSEVATVCESNDVVIDPSPLYITEKRIFYCLN